MQCHREFLPRACLTVWTHSGFIFSTQCCRIKRNGTSSTDTLMAERVKHPPKRKERRKKENEENGEKFPQRLKFSSSLFQGFDPQSYLSTFHVPVLRDQLKVNLAPPPLLLLLLPSKEKKKKRKEHLFNLHNYHSPSPNGPNNNWPSNELWLSSFTHISVFVQ